MESTFSEDLRAKLKEAHIRPPTDRPWLLKGVGEWSEWDKVRERIDCDYEKGLNNVANSALKKYDRSKTKSPYYDLLPVLRSLSEAAFLVNSERFADRTKEKVEEIFRYSAEEWIVPGHQKLGYKPCDHTMLNIAAGVAIAIDLCARFWPAKDVRAFSEKLYVYTMPRFLDTWNAQDPKAGFWTVPAYHENWKIMCCGEAGLTALACAEVVPDLLEADPDLPTLQKVLDASLEGVLDFIDYVPQDGSSVEGPAYLLNPLGYGLRFGLALHRATDGEVDLFEHPRLHEIAEYFHYVTEPDGGMYNFSDTWPHLSHEMDYLSLLGMAKDRPVVQRGKHTTLGRVAWVPDPATHRLSTQHLSTKDTARCFPDIGVAAMRSSWHKDATFVGFKCGPRYNHGHLDANSFVVSGSGERLLIDEGVWEPYAKDLGCDDEVERRWNFDANGTAGHNTLLVDGQGQRRGKEKSERAGGRIVKFRHNADIGADRMVDVAVGDATEAYGGKLQKFLRTLVFVKPDLLLVFDQIAAYQPCFLEWLFHFPPQGTVRGDDQEMTLSLRKAALTLRRVSVPKIVSNPDKGHLESFWRVSDVKRTTAYHGDPRKAGDPGEFVHRSVRYWSFGPVHRCKEIEVLWAIYVGDSEAFPDEKIPEDLPTSLRRFSRARS